MSGERSQRRGVGGRDLILPFIVGAAVVASTISIEAAAGRGFSLLAQAAFGAAFGLVVGLAWMAFARRRDERARGRRRFSPPR